MEDIVENTGKRILTATDIRKYLKVRHATALEYLGKGKTITVFEFARELLKKG